MTGKGKKTGATKKSEAAKNEAAKSEQLLVNGKTPPNIQSMRIAWPMYAGDVPLPPDDQLYAALRKIADDLIEKERKAAKKEGREDNVLKCDAVCMETSTDASAFCPFCGDGLDDWLAENPQPAPAENGSALATTDATVPEVLTETEQGILQKRTELAQAAMRVDELRRDIVANGYDLGVELKRIKDQDLWKVTDHKTFAEYCEKVHSISKTAGYRYLLLVEQFDRETYLQVGVTKLLLIAGADTTEREQLLDEAKAGASTRELARASKGDAGEKGSGGSKSNGSAPPRETRDSAAPPKKSKNDITLLVKVNGKQIPMTWHNPETGRPLQKYRDGAYGELQISDEVFLRVAPKFAGDDLDSLSAVFVRAE